MDIALRPQATRWRAGEVLRLKVRGSWFYPRDPVRGQLPTGYQRRATGSCVLHAGAGRDAFLLAGHRPIRSN